MQKVLASLAVVSLTVGLLGWGPARAADDSKVKQGAKQVESGAKQVGEGVADTAKGIGKTVVGGAEVAGEKVKEAGDAAKPKVESAWGSVRDGAVSFGQGVKGFFIRLFHGSPEEEPGKEKAGS